MLFIPPKMLKKYTSILNMFLKWKYKYKSELHLSLEYLQNNWQRRGLGKMFLSANFQDGDCYFGKKRMIKQIRAIFLI